MENIVKLAEQIATEAHKGQKRWNGEDYINHPKRVANMMNTDELKAIAWLHDVLEDTKVTFEELYKRGIPAYICEAVDQLTREKDQNYKDFILQVKENDLAIEVKLGDLRDNLSDLKNGSLRDKYLLALYILKN